MAYGFPDGSGLENYVLRNKDSNLFAHTDDEIIDHNREAVASALKKSTYLTPVDRLVRDLQIGQPFMALNRDKRITLHIRQPGTPLSRIQENLVNHALSQQVNSLKGDTSIAHVEGAVAFMETLLNVRIKNGGKNPFLPILKQTYQLAYAGYRTDWGLPNILLADDEASLGLVDQVHMPRGCLDLRSSRRYATAQLNNAVAAMHAGLDYGASYIRTLAKDDPLRQRYDHAQRTLYAWVDEALTQVQAMNAAEASRIHRLAFAEVKDVGGVALTSPPHALLHQLDLLRERSQLR